MVASNNDLLYRATVIGHTPGGEKWVNVFHLFQAASDDSTLTLARAQAIRDRFATFYNAIKSIQNQNYGVDQFVIKNMQADHDGEQFELTPAAAIAGGATVGAIPSQNAVVVSWKTVKAGKKYRGRTYLAGFDKSAMDDTIHGLTSTNQSLIGNAARALLDGLTTDGRSLAVWSRVEPPAGGDVNAITAARVGRIFDTQRRRRNKFNEAYVSF